MIFLDIHVLVPRQRFRRCPGAPSWSISTRFGCLVPQTGRSSRAWTATTAISATEIAVFLSLKVGFYVVSVQNQLIPAVARGGATGRPPAPPEKPGCRPGSPSPPGPCYYNRRVAGGACTRARHRKSRGVEASVEPKPSGGAVRLGLGRFCSSKCPSFLTGV